MYNYSIIIPFRDNIALLPKALDSIPARDDIQVIVIDNSVHPFGKESCGLSCDERMVYLISDPDKGAGCARNVGLKYATGKYLLFLDADDFFVQGAFDIFDLYLESGCDVIFFNASSVKLADGTVGKRHLRIDRIIRDSIKSGNYDILRYQYENPVSKMIRRDFVEVRSLLFQEVKVSNDMMFSLKAGHYAKTISVVDKVVYMITEGDINSSLTRTRNRENQFIRFTVALDHDDFVKAVGRPDMTYRLYSYVVHAFVDFGFAEGFRWIRYWVKRCQG